MLMSLVVAATHAALLLLITFFAVIRAIRYMLRLLVVVAVIELSLIISCLFAIDTARALATD